MKVLVTGASGFIGREVTERLCRRGYDVHAVARNPIEISGARWHRVDLLDDLAVERLVSALSPSHLVHLAWTTETGKFWSSPDNSEWDRATRALFDVFASNGGKRFVGAGSVAEYVWNESPCREWDTETEPGTLYGRAKLAAFRYIHKRAQELGIADAWGRIFWLYGPHEHPQRLVPHVITGILQGRTVDCSNGEQLRDFMHVYDVAEAFVRLIESEVVGPVNVASGRAVAVKDIISHLADVLDGRDAIRLGAIASNSTEPKIVCADVARLTAELLFVPQHSLEDGLDATVSWWKAKLDSESTPDLHKVVAR